jgi:RNA polymerase primary sigma factor
MTMSAESAILHISPAEIGAPPLGRIARAPKIASARLKYVDHPSFDDPSVRNAILAPLADSTSDKLSAVSSLPPRLAPVPETEVATPFLSREQEAHLFRKMNYLKCRVNRLVELIDQGSASPAVLEEIERLKSEALAVKNRIVQTNLRLVIFVVKQRNSAQRDISDLVSEGNLALIQAVDHFDFARGNRFSTYATWAIRNALVSKARSDRRHHARPFGMYESSLVAVDPGIVELEDEGTQDRRRSTVRRWFARLGKREQWVLANRYGLGGAPERTLAQLARELGISKQRVSQIAAKAESKVRRIARCETLEALES